MIYFYLVHGFGKPSLPVFQSMAGIVKKIRKPKPWKFPQPVRWNQSVHMRDVFFYTTPHHGRKKGKSTSFDLKLVDVIMFLSREPNKLA